ncbi:MAG: hypothetical protein C4541_12475 [Candidatus Auribacter fodinae]|uniref:Alpha-D-phosphohexomutase alpha/beta/alpha domain-containing protein n=1 Tax=Candidatus Auribacter fodinae TaxID=2093366 RepID=A0A3A4R0N1_9BACT|nr:MAG: hypothetical protein C4541_12475 [Candidatus Auribacter fodinae]
MNLFSGSQRKMWLRCLALFVCQSLVLSPNYLQAQPDDQVRVNRRYGRVVNSYVNDQSDVKIIHIQDAHCIEEAQLNIASMLRDLSRDYNIQLIGLEGASGGLDTQRLRNYPDKAALKEVSEYFIKSGKLSGAEYYSINNENADNLLGIEDKDLYTENFSKLLNCLPVRETALSYFNIVQNDLILIQEKFLSKELLEFNKIVSQYREVENNFVDYCVLLEQYCGRLDLSIDNFENFTKFLDTTKLEQTIQFNLVNNEKSAVLDKLSQLLAKEELSILLQKNLFFRINKISSREYYDYIAEQAKNAGVELAEYPNFVAYTEYLSSYDAINQKKLFSETDDIAALIRTGLSVSEDDKVISKLIQSSKLLAKYTTLQLSTDELKRFEKEVSMSFDEFNSAVNGYLRKMNVSEYETAMVQQVSDGFSQLDEFYEIARKRDLAMVDRLLAEMDLEGINTAVLIAGGFHTEGVLAELRERGISYDVVIPEITREQENNPYFNLISNLQSDFEQFLASNTLQLPLRTANLDLLNRNDQVVFMKEVDVLLTLLSADQRIARAMTEAEMIEHINAILSQYDNKFDVKILGRVRIPGADGYRGYLLRVDGRDFTFKVQDPYQLPSADIPQMAVALDDKVITALHGDSFSAMLSQRAQDGKADMDSYSVALSSEYRHRLAISIMEDLLKTLFEMGELADSDIQEKVAELGLDVTPEIHKLMNYFVASGLVKLTHQGEDISAKFDGGRIDLPEGFAYVWYSPNATRNITWMRDIFDMASGVIGRVLTNNEIRFTPDFITPQNQAATGNIKLFYFEAGMPMDIQYRVLAELYAGRNNLFRKDKPGVVEFQALNGDVYEIRVVYRDEDGGYFFRAGLKDAQAQRIAQRVLPGRAFIESPVVSLKNKGIQISSQRPFENAVVGVPKFYIDTNPATGERFLNAAILEVDKTSRTVRGLLSELSIKQPVNERVNVTVAFKQVLAQLLKSAAERQIGMLPPLIDAQLRELLTQGGLDLSLLEIAIEYPETNVASVLLNADGTITADRFVAEIAMEPQAVADTISIAYDLLGKAEVDAIIAEKGQTGAIEAFYEAALPKAQNALNTILAQYGLSGRKVELDITLSPGMLAEAHLTELDSFKVVINAHAFRSPGLLYAQLEHEIRHHFVKEEAKAVLVSLITANLRSVYPSETDINQLVELASTELTPAMVDFITELYISAKELDRYDQFGLDPDLGVATVETLRSDFNPLDPKGEFVSLLELTGDERFALLRNIVANRFFADEESALPENSLIQNALIEIERRFSRSGINGDYQLIYDQKGNFSVWSDQQEQASQDAIQKLIGANVPFPATVKMSPEVSFAERVSIGSDVTILGSNISIGKQADIGKGVKILSDGGTVTIQDGVVLEPGTVIVARAGDVITIGPGTVIQRSKLQGSVNIGAGAFISNSNITNANIDSTPARKTFIQGSTIWGQTSAQNDLVVIKPGVTVTYSQLKSITAKKSVNLLQYPHDMFRGVLDPAKYVIAPVQTVVDSGTVIEKATIINSTLGTKVNVRENSHITNSIISDTAVSRINAQIDLTFMGKSTEIGSKVTRSYFGDGAKSEHQGSELEHVIMPNEYVIVDENGAFKKIFVPNTTNIGAGTILKNNTGIPVIMYHGFTGINSHITSTTENPTIILPFTLTKGTTNGLLLPYAYSDTPDVAINGWMLTSYAGALVNHYKKTQSSAAALGYSMDDFDQLFTGSIRLAVKLIDDQINNLKAGVQTEPVTKQISALEKSRITLLSQLLSGGWDMQNGNFINGMLSWRPGDKWTTDLIDEFQQFSADDLNEFGQLYQFLQNNLQVPDNYRVQVFDGVAEMGTDGIRGVAENIQAIDSKHVTPSLGYRLGLVAALYAAYNGKDSVFVGGDTRPSREYLIPAVVMGATQMGMKVKHEQLFNDHTPGAQYKVLHDESLGGGVVVTASHNPHYDNGFKMLDINGSKVPALWERIANQVVNSRNLPHTLALIIRELGGREKFSSLLDNLAGQQVGQQEWWDESLDNQYVDEIISAMKVLLPPSETKRVFKIDTASGAGVRLLQVLQKRQSELPNVQFELLNTEGTINDRVGAEYIHKSLSKDIASGKGLPQWIQDRIGEVIGTLDGDADRNLLFRVNEVGELEVIDGDKFAALKVAVLQKYIKEAGLDADFQVGVAQTVLANMGSKKFFESHSVPVMKTKVGDKYVREAATQWALGDGKDMPAHGVGVYYEAAGHGSMIFSNEFIEAVKQAPASRAKDVLQAILDIQNMAGGDGIRNLLLFYALMEMEGLDFDKLNDPSYLYPEVPKIELEMRVKYKNNVTSVDDLGEELTAPSDLVDFVNQTQQRLGGDYRIIVRASGTSPKVRVQVDGPDKHLREEAAYQIAQAIYDSPNIIGDTKETSPINKYNAMLDYQRQLELKQKQADFLAQYGSEIRAQVEAKFTEDPRYSPQEVTGRAEVGTDGIRGKASPALVLNKKEITPPIAYRMGITIALKALSEGKDVVHVAGDTRPSTQYLMDAFIAGAQQMGVLVVEDGLNRVSSTPQLQLFVRVDDLAGSGGIISASHNPAEDNGIKLVDQTGGKIPAEWEDLTNQMVNSQNLAETISSIIARFETNGAPDKAKVDAALASLGTVKPLIANPEAQMTNLGTEKSYVDRVVDAMQKLDKLSGTPKGVTNPFVIDTAAGAGSITLQEIADVINDMHSAGEISIQMNLVNTEGVINEEKGAEFIHKELGKELAAGKPAPEWIQNLVGVDVGTIDGDADRNLFFRLNQDGSLQVVDGDKFAALKAMVLQKYMGILGLDQQFNVGVAQTVLANLGSKGFFERRGIEVMETAVGDKYVRQAALDWVKDNGIAIYYEAAGHGSILFSDEFKQALGKSVIDSPEKARAADILSAVIQLQNEAGGDGIMNLLLFKMLMVVEGLDFDKLMDDNFLYRDLPKTELELRVHHKENVTSIEGLGKQLTGPADLVAYVDEVQKGLQKELEDRLARGELTEADLPIREFRVIVRASGTSPKMRVQVDGPVDDMAQKAAYQIMQFIYDSESIKGVNTEPRPMDQYNEIVENQHREMLAKLTVTQEDGARLIYGWSALTEQQRLNILLDLTQNGFTSAKLQKLVDVHKAGGETAGEPPTGQPVYEQPAMKDISRSNTKDRTEAVQLGIQKSNIDRSALVIMAGGDGSRLLGQLGFSENEMGQWSKPTIPVTSVTQKPPLQLILENMAKIRADADSAIPIVLVVGPRSKGPIKAFLKDNKYFGIDNIVVVEQGKHPVMKQLEPGQDPKIILTPDATVEYNPNGTGGIVDVLGNAVAVSGTEFASVVDYLDSLNRDKVVFWQGDVGGFTPELFHGILGVSKGVSGTEDVDIVGLAYKSNNRKLGTLVSVNGSIMIIESGDRNKYPGLDEADDVSSGKQGFPRNSGGYMISLQAIKKLIGNFPVHLQPEKDIMGYDFINSAPIAKADKMEEYLPDLFLMLADDSAISSIIGIADEDDMVPQKSPQQLQIASKKLVDRDSSILRGNYPGMVIDNTANVEISPLFEGNIGTGIGIGPKAEVYIGKNLTLGDGASIGKNVRLRGDNISIGKNVIIADGATIIAEGTGRVEIRDGAVINGSVNIRVKDGETIVIGNNSVISEGTTFLGSVSVGNNTQIRSALIEYAVIGNDTVIANSSLRGQSLAQNVIVGNRVSITAQSIITTSAKGKSWSFLEDTDLRADFSPVDEFVLRRYSVSSKQSIISDGAMIVGARLNNTQVGRETLVQNGAAIEHSIIGNESRITGTANITLSYLGNNVIIGSEVSKSYLGEGVIAENGASYVSTIAPNEFILANENGELYVLSVPNPTVIGERVVFANYGGKPLPDLSGSQKGTSILYAADIANANPINLYDHPDIQLTDVVNERNVTVVYPFAQVPFGEIWGKIYPFTEATSLSAAKHRIGSVLESNPRSIVQKAAAMYRLLPEGRKDDVKQVVVGSLRIGIKMINDEIAGLNAVLAKRPDDARTLARLSQLQQGLAIYTKHLESGVWDNPLTADFSGIAMNNFSPEQKTIDFVKVLGNKEVITLQDKIQDDIIADSFTIAEIRAILQDLAGIMTADERTRFEVAIGPQGTVRDQLQLFVDIARDRLKQVRDVLSEQYRGIENLTFVIALGTERLAERHVANDNRIVINANALRSPYLMFAEAEHELTHEIIETDINDSVDTSALRGKQIVEAIFQNQLQSTDLSEPEIIAESQKQAGEFYDRLKEFMKEEFIISRELDRIRGLSADAQAQILSVLRDPNNPIDKGAVFADLLDSAREALPNERRKLVQNYILAQYDGMGIVSDTISTLQKLRSTIPSQVVQQFTQDDFDLLHLIENGTNPDGTLFDGSVGNGITHYFASLLMPSLINEQFVVDINEAGQLFAHQVDNEDLNAIQSVDQSVGFDISVIDFDVFGDAMITDSNSLFLADTLERIRNNALKNGRQPKIVMYSLNKDAGTMREFLRFHDSDPDSVLIIDRNDIVARADALAQSDAGFAYVAELLRNARAKNDYTEVNAIFDRVEKGDRNAMDVANQLMSILLGSFEMSLNLPEFDITDIKLTANKPGLVQVAVSNNIRSIEWDVLGSDLVNEGDLIQAGIDNLLLLEVLEPGSEIPRELIVTAVAVDKVINGINVYDVFTQEQQRREAENIEEPITIEYLVSQLGIASLTKEDIKGIGVKAPKRKIDREFQFKLQQQRLFDQSA